MNTNKKILLILSIFLGYQTAHTSQSTQNQRNLPGRTVNFSPNLPAQHNSMRKIIVSEEEMRVALQTREEQANKNYDDIEHHANELIKQNYKTDRMKYNILLLMQSDNTQAKKPISQYSIDLPSVDQIQNQTTPFMQVNVATASIENLPTIFQILEKTTGTDPQNENRPVILNGLQATLRAINGALADIKYDKKYIFASDIELRLRKMQQQIETRIQELNPYSWLKLSLGISSLVAMTAAAGAYYSGMTLNSMQDSLADIIKKYKPAADMLNAA